MQNNKMTIINFNFLNKALLFIFAFTLAFERAFPFLPGLSFPKAAAILYLASLILNPSYMRVLLEIKANKLIFMLLGIWLLLNVFNGGLLKYGIEDLDIPFFLNIALVWILLNHERLDPGILEKALIYFSLGYFCLVIIYYLGFYQTLSNGRVLIGKALPNALGMGGVFAICGALKLLRMRFNYSFFVKPLICIGALMIISLILATGSRSSLLALVFVVGIFFFWSSIKVKLGLIIVGIILIPLALPFFSIIIERSSSTIENVEFGGRLMYWVFMLEVISQNILLGVGQGGYNFLTNLQFGHSPSPHNVFVEVFILGGLTAFVLWLWLLKVVLAQGLYSIRYEKNLTKLMLAPPILLIGVSGQIFNNSLVFYVFALIFSTTMIYTKQSRAMHRKI